ncbi:hypothetical protein LOZ80_06250 [Paenibacillus sp. HWE-109]|uniref:DUF7674 family protein n=1 Tax=Paenibacillus sp. HWE-109 TaxID=1306526 RepID=UPI001EE0F1BB|nr:hypothetical protein [Paenibacillus sp. HWE-109]UKS28531.1 hypothetical protein LOZ80_06250 [Paenibacillus sp. HWE-109]
MKYNELSKIFVNEFPKFRLNLTEHEALYKEVLNHVFFGDLNDYLIELLRKDIETELLIRLFEFYERMELKGDTLVKEVLSCTILERLGDEKEILEVAYRYMGKETRKASDNIERAWGRL